jgi:hypothetical protein
LKQSCAQTVLTALNQAATKPQSQTLYHQVEDAGYGATLSRLMTGLNRALTCHANYSFKITSNYEVESLFKIHAKQEDRNLPNTKRIHWDFWRDTWSTKTRPYFWKFFVTEQYRHRVRAEHQYPTCPLELGFSISRHQWCSALAFAICGHPSSLLQEAIEIAKQHMGWDNHQKIVGIHVRRGDKNTECRYIPNPIYIEHFKKLIKANSDAKWSIFLTSDDPNCFGEFQNELPDTTILWDHSEERFNNSNIHMIRTQPDLAMQESIAAAKNISLLGQCDYVIGMASAQFTWIGGLLCIFRHNLDTSHQIMLDPQTLERGHWATTYGYTLSELLA